MSFDLCARLGRDKKHLFQKLLPIEKVDTKKLKFPMYASEKYDGVFCCAILDDEGGVHICSRTGEEFLSMEHLKKPFKEQLAYVPTSYIIFEACIPNKTQNIVSGACRDTKNQHPEIVSYLHTFVENDVAFLTGGEVGEWPSFFIVDHKPVHSLSEAMRLAEEIWNRGGEGLVLHMQPFQPYQPGKRNASIIKIKKGLSVDLKCIDVFEGEGKYAGTLGGIVCSYNGKPIRVSGMTDAERKAWWEDNTLIIGKIVQIDAMGESAKGVLREPRFKGIRFDKEEPDC